MKTLKDIQHWLNHHPKVKQWGWFILLWLGGLLSVMALSYPIKYIINL